MKKYKQYENYKDCDLIWLKEIPEHWKILSFRNILVERNEKNSPIKSKERLSLSINKGVTLYADKTTNLDRFKDDFTKYKLAHESDLVLNSMNMIVGAVGVSNYFGCVSPIYYTFTSDPDNCNSTKYYEYLFRSKIVQGVLFSLGRGLIAKDRGDGKYNTLRLKVSRGDLRPLKLPNPNYSEQRQIASFLDYKIAKINRFIRKKKQLIKLLNEKKAVLINQAFTKGLDPKVKMKESGIEWLGEIPEHWEVSKLKYIADVVNGSTPKSDNSDYWNGDLNWATPEDISKVHGGKIYETNRKITLNGLQSCGTTLVPVNSIILTTRAPIGNIALSEVEICTNQGCKALVPRANFPGKYLMYYLIAKKNVLDSLGRGTTFMELSTYNLKNLEIVYSPNKDEIVEILSFIEDESKNINETIATIEKEIFLVEEYKTSLIAEAVTGKIDVRDFEIPKKEELEEIYEEVEEELNMVAEEQTIYENEAL